MAAHQAALSLGFSRQEHWSGLPFPSPMHESEKWKWSRSVCPTLSDPMDCSLPGSSIHGIFQARVLEWGAIAFIGNIKNTHLGNIYTVYTDYLYWSSSFSFSCSSSNYNLLIWDLLTFSFFFFKQLPMYLRYEFMTGFFENIKHN